MISGPPSADGTASPGSQPTSCRFAGSPRQVALIIREDSGGFAAGGTQRDPATAAGMRADIVPLLHPSVHLFRTVYENR
ncbi:hypothetical protein GCM10010361_12080 [Streptomyces olivaceiscleroticus]|uniref:Uncharacterized protein n=1 Tax=Streptomyces olivaceiscleroticus TaxID=68245 RepID=A0ABN0ZIZ6_9ACTN